MSKVINLFGASGVGKSTIAYGLTYNLRINKKNAEYVSEYAKDKSWMEDIQTLKLQPYVAAKQWYRQNMPLGKTDYVITDSPLLLSCVYGKYYKNPSFTPEFESWLFSEFNRFDNINILLKRNDTIAYVTEGRNQSIDEARILDVEIKNMLDTNNIPYIEILSSPDTVDIIISML